MAPRNNVLEEIRKGNWDFEPGIVDSDKFDATQAMPGSNEKIEAIAARARAGLPLWNKNDRQSYDDSCND